MASRVPVGTALAGQHGAGLTASAELGHLEACGHRQGASLLGLAAAAGAAEQTGHWTGRPVRSVQGGPGEDAEGHRFCPQTRNKQNGI